MLHTGDKVGYVDCDRWLPVEQNYSLDVQTHICRYGHPDNMSSLCSSSPLVSGLGPANSHAGRVSVRGLACIPGQEALGEFPGSPVNVSAYSKHVMGEVKVISL